jgi:hypothetical protein
MIARKCPELREQHWYQTYEELVALFAKIRQRPSLRVGP